MITPMQTNMFPKIGSQQASTVALQSSVIPTQTTSTSIDITSLMNLMITMMIVVMMMKMMTGAMSQIS